MIKLISAVLDLLYSLTHSWGWAIILFAATAKALLIPLTNHQFRSMKEMQVLQPEIKRLQDKYKSDPQIFQKKFAELMRSRKVNPFSGCLISMVVQIPILYALYYVIRDHIDKFSTTGFLWIGAFAEKLVSWFPGAANWVYNLKGSCELSTFLKPSFPYLGTSLATTDWPLLLLYGASMIAYSKLNSPPNPDPHMQQQQSMMNLMMPVMSILIFRTFPSAFILYWLVFNLFSIVHQYWFYRTYEPEPVPVSRGKKEERR